MKFPTKQEFLDVFELFPRGNPETVYTEVKYTIMSKKTFSGDPVTWELISSRFTAYITKRQKEGVQDKFIKSFDSFLKAGDYNIDFSNEPSMEKKNSFQTGMDDTLSELEKRLKGYE